MISKFSLFYHTLRYLKPSQIYRRVWFRLLRHPRVDITTSLALRQVSGKWLRSSKRDSSLLDADTFCFLNVSGSLSELGWDGEQREKLWRYNQHYFDDLNAVHACVRSEWHYALLNSWVAENPVGVGTGWEPYPTSLRIVNWVKWHLSGHILPDVCVQSLAVQARWLVRRMEWHILGNHLFANAKALVFAGLFFNGNEAKKWLETGLAVIARELPEQVLQDGGNFERSPMYHAIFLEDILDLINLANAYAPVIEEVQVFGWRRRASKMLAWLEAMCHPDGEISFFNDAAIGIAPSHAEIVAYAMRLGVFVEGGRKLASKVTVSQFADSGYIRLDAANAVAFLDVAPIGPDYLPGHAHADTLSFELSLYGRRFLVNGGTSQYGSGVVRLQERGTAAHNTVEVDGENSSEVWSGFRVARRAYPVDLDIQENDELVSVTCGHTGYRRLHGSPVHKRTWHFCSSKLLVSDRIEGCFKSAVARFNFHPYIQLVDDGESSWLLRIAGCESEARINVRKGNAKIEKGFYSPAFGKRIQTSCLNVCFEAASDIAVEILWSDHETS